ncbi:hypothetical protein ECPA45_0143, partial [Escherichia coli PA45]|jgi:hypothetical protein
MGRP